MSRRSLRLEEGLLDRTLPHSIASFSVGGASWRSNRLLKPRRSQHLLSSSCSESLNTPLKASGPRPLPEGGGGLSSSSITSDASLLSSLLDESSVQDSTLVDAFWGLDADVDPKESTSIADQSVLAPEALKHHPVSAYRSTSKYTSSSETGTSTLYSRDRTLRSRTGVLLWFLLWVRRTSAGCVRALTLTWQVCRELCSQVNPDNRRGARSGLCGVMDLKGSTAARKELHPDASLCDDCQEKPSSSSSSSSLASCLWSVAGLAASGLSQLTQTAASAVWPATKKMFSASRSAGRSAGDVFRKLNKRWHHMTSSVLTGFPVRLLLVLLPLLLLFSLWWFGPAVNVSEMGTVVSGFVSFQSRPAEGAGEEPREVQPPNHPPAAVEEEEAELRLVRLEETQVALWHQVEAGGQRAEQRHTEVLQLYADLQQLVSDQNQQLDPDQNQQLDQQLSGGPDEDRRQTEKQRSPASRLDQLELQLRTLAARTQEAPWSRGAATGSPSSATLPAAAGGGMDRPSHDALLAEVARLGETLEDLRRDVQGLGGGLDRLQPTVREEVRVLVYGNQLTVGGGDPESGGGAPESLLQWLSLRYVSGADLQVELASLELKILQNLSLQLEQHRRGEELREEEEVLHATGAAMTQEDVQDIVRNALRLFSQDQTGLADFALESGGGSVLNTRCSETHQAKVALYSLFGVPLWYFSQSPRAVIQPDVHPGNCWAFRGSVGFLVIRLSARILPTAFSLEHLPRALAPTRGGLSSAPRDFSVYGLQDEGQEGGKLLGSFAYDKAGEALQTFRVTEENDEAFHVIELQVLSNWGHQEYTCLYRFRAHGMPEEVVTPQEGEELEVVTPQEGEELDEVAMLEEVTSEELEEVAMLQEEVVVSQEGEDEMPEETAAEAIA